ncbi:MAG: type II toxin-antitoxin system PemK/MazF family toxin [Prevotellaceae bacterium]|jgi:mRNA interferase MazF|nr:type II toxin-antitoxin system PemK/MazF family toxin [Prevotellaceae bacterium]
MTCKKYEIRLVDLNQQTETGKVRPVLIEQADLLNKLPHPSTLVCPITTNTVEDVSILRVSLKRGTANLHEDCDIMIDQARVIDNKRLIKKIGSLPQHLTVQVQKNILIIFDFEK